MGTEEIRVIVGHEDTNRERSQDVEEQDSPENTADCLGNVLSWVLRLTGCNRDHLDTTVREGGIDKSGEKAEEASGIGVRADVSFHCTRILPVSKPNPVMGGPSAKIETDSHNQKTHDSDNFDAGKDEFGFSVDGDGKDV